MKRKKFFTILLSFVVVLSLVAGVLSQVAVQAQAETVSLDALLEGKTLSVLGDSISTFNGVSNTTAAETTNSTIADGRWYYPAPEVSTVDMTWWMQTANALGMKLLVNNSWSGSYIFKERTYTDGPGVKGAYVDRCVQLHDDTGENAGETPDIIAIYLGTNDFKSDNSHIGTYAAVNFDTLITGSEGAYTYSTPTTSMEAYAICLHKISQRYPDAEVYCFTLLPREVGATQPAEYSADIAKMAEHFGCYVVDLYNECGIVSSDYSFKLMMRDTLHPAFGGMQAISSVFTSSILRNSKYLPEDTQVFDFSYTLNNVLTTGGKPNAALGGQALELKLAAGAAEYGVDQVTVTMGGQDITADCYADGVISIPAVTGDVTVTANAKRTVPLHDHICDNCSANTNWQYWDGTVSDLEKGGHFFLAGDTTMSGTFTTEKLANQQDLDVTICLNGYTLYGPAKGRMFRISHGSKLSIVDCTAKTENGVYTAGKLIPRYHGIRAVVAGIFDVGTSEFNLYDGIIDGGGNNNNSTVSASNIGGGLIDLTGPDAEVNLYGGVLKDYSSYYGGAVYCSAGLVTVDGATIQNCNATRGMAIMIRSNGEGVIESGRILGGDLYHGVISVRDKGKLTINGGKIGDAFGKYAYGVHMMDANTSVTMTGGEISGNALQGVWIENGTFAMTGGEIKGNLCGMVQDGGSVNISGGKIVGNTAIEETGIRYTTGDISITGGMFDTDVEAFTAEGYTQLVSGLVDVVCGEHDFVNGSCSRCGDSDGSEPPQQNGLLAGITLSVLGDSISTYKDVSGGAAAQTGNSTIGDNAYSYPKTYMPSLNSTWWMQAVNDLGMELLVNNSWSSSYIFKDRSYENGTIAYGAYQNRCVQLHDDTGDNAGEKPDIIAFYLGTNDFNFDNTRNGSYEAVNFNTLITGSAGNYTYATPTTTMEAYAICLHKMRQAYPDAEIYCFTILPRRGVNHLQPEAFNADVKQMAAHFGCFVVDLYNDSGITNDIVPFGTMIGDDLHPNSLGMDSITAAFVSAILENSKYIPEGTQTYKVSYDFDGVCSKSGKPSVVLENSSLQLDLISAASYLRVDQVTVTMGGVDITESCYKDGTVSIDTVTGDVTISAKTAWNTEKHTHECEHCDVSDQWIPWNGDVEQLYFGGHFFLTDDTTMSDDFNVESLPDPAVNVTICLNGHTLYGSTTSRMFRISHGAKVNIVDCTAKTENGVYTAGSIVPQYHNIRGVVAGIFGTGESEFNLYDGIIDGGGNNNNSVVSSSAIGGGLIDIATATGKVNLYGGVLKDYSSYYGGAVYCGAGEVTVDGATIKDCNATRGRAIMIRGSSASVTIESGEILGGTQSHGLIAMQNGGQMVMNGGKVGNTAGNNGNGVHITGAASTFEMNGGEISGNSGYGVWIENGSFQMTDGIISQNLCGILQDNGSVKISGGRITDNTAETDNGIRHNAGNLSITGGIFDTDVSAYVAEGYEQYPNGKVGQPCEHPSYQDGVCENCGEKEPEKSDYNGLVDVNGEWGYYIDGVLRVDYTGLVEHGGYWFYVENGLVNWDYIGMTFYNGVWFYVKDGMVDWNYVGLTLYNGTWFYIENGMVNWDYVGLTQYNGWWFYVEGGMVNWEYVGMTQFGGYWFYVANGLVDWEYNSLTQYNGYWFYIDHGMVNWDYVGLVAYNGALFYVSGGQVDWSYNGTSSHNGATYLVENGMATQLIQGFAVSFTEKDHSIYDYSSSYEKKIELSYSLPTVTGGNADVAAKINTTMWQAYQAYLQRVSDEHFEGMFEYMWEGDVFLFTETGTLSYIDNNILSLYYVTDWWMGGVANSIPYGYTFDLNTGLQPALADLFSCDDAYLLTRIKTEITAYLRDAGLLDSYTQSTINNYTLSSFDFYISQEGELIICIPVYELGPGAAGSFEIPCGVYI